MRANLALLWHMHQPYYRNVRSGECPLPWVRLHGIHSYYDMVRLHEAHPDIRATINFVPCLIQQLYEYVHERKGDAFLDLTMLPAESLTEVQQEFIIRNFFSAQPQCMIAPYARYRSLFERRGINPTTADLTEAIRFYSTQDFRDIQVLFNLVWFGFTAREELPEIKQMLDSGGKFSEQDKEIVLQAQMKIMDNLLQAISRLARSDNVEIATTPYNHPILPLLIDTGVARRPSPRLKLPQRLTARPYADYQVKRALGFMEEATGVRPKGMWPAEGAVSPEMIPMLADAGIIWIATDEGILERSTVRGKDRTSLAPYTAEHEGKQVAMVFRNRELSDKISFVYGGMDTERAVDDFIHTFMRLETTGTKDGSELVAVILDGENPWEHYRNGGKDFLTALFARIKREGIPTTTMTSYVERQPPKRRIDKLASGSWINADFSIWIGKPQKNQAWEYIRKSLEELDHVIAPRPDMSADAVRALDSFCAACGSDWLWWYDDDFESIFKVAFDTIFRTHLENAFTLLKGDAPHYLLDPIYHLEDREQAFVEPPAFIHPNINGISDSYFEWANALRIDMRRFGGAMAPREDIIKAVYFGYDQDAIYLRFDPQDAKQGIRLNAGESIVISILGEGINYGLHLAYEDGTLNLTAHGGEAGDAASPRPEFGAGRILELKCPFACFPHRVGTRLTLVIALKFGDTERRRYASVRFAVPDENYEQRMWTV